LTAAGGVAGGVGWAEALPAIPVSASATSALRVVMQYVEHVDVMGGLWRLAPRDERTRRVVWEA
jgi:hypothetical protein